MASRSPRYETRGIADLGHSSDGPSWIDLAEIRVSRTESEFAPLSQPTSATKSANSRRREPTSFNQLFRSGEQRRRNFEAQRLGSLEVDHQLEFGRLHDREVGGLLTFEDPTGVDAGLTICIGNAGTVAHQYSGSDMLSPRRYRRYCIAFRQRGELSRLAGKECVLANDHCPSTAIGQG